MTKTGSICLVVPTGLLKRIRFGAAVSGGGAKIVQDASLDASTVPVLERISPRTVSVPELGMTTELKVKLVPFSPTAEPTVAGVVVASTWSPL